ncbi:MAG: type II secretion system protein [Acutalibacteraceae bacterium]
MNKKTKRLRSKKGMTLVELLVGVTIVVIVFAGTLGAMFGGFSTTVGNADQNKVAAKNVATNEVIMDTIKKIELKIEDAEDCVDALKTGSTEPSAAAIQAAAEKQCSGIKYVDSSQYPKNDVDCQYTLIIDKTSSVNGHNVKGIIIKTAMKSSAGFVFNQSFVPYQE